MKEIRQLVLPDTYEDLVKELGDDYARMSQFVVPVEEAEKRLVLIAQTIKNSGKIVLLLGLPGVGKSTFILSLTWRKHLPISEIIEIDANQFFGGDEKPLQLLYQELQRKIHQQIRSQKPDTVPTIVINYLENLAGQVQEDIRAFFRNVNGLLRRNPVLIIWPVTEKKDAESLLELASAVSGTVFSEKPILEFMGPQIKEFPRIAKDTISTLNPGLSFDDFLLNDDELSAIADRLKRENISGRTIRHYLRAVKVEWQEKSGELERLIERIPKPTEVWIIVCYSDAESVVSQFARKSPYAPDDAWDADYRRLSEYVYGNAQRSADWDPKRLQFALRGAFRTKIMFLPTNAVVSCVAAYGSHFNVEPELLDKIWAGTIDNWRKPVIARRFLGSSPVVRQLKGEPAKLGKRRSGASAQSIKAAEDAFMEINRFTQDTSDQPINRCLAQGLRDSLEWNESDIIAECPHPFLEGIRADILIRNDPSKIICVEMFYTVNKTPSTLANYVLSKMDRYMKQLDLYSLQPRLLIEDL